MNRHDQLIQDLLEGNTKMSPEVLELIEPQLLISHLIMIGINPSKKKYWGNAIQLLSNFVDDPRVVDFMIDALSDPNWPGYTIAYSTLFNVGRKILDPLESKINQCILDRDELALQSLLDLKTKILIQDY